MLLWGLSIDPLYIVLLIAILFGAAQLFTRWHSGRYRALPISAGPAGAPVGERPADDIRKRQDDEAGLKRVPTAAAMTYAATAVTSIATLLYYIPIARR